MDGALNLNVFILFQIRASFTNLAGSRVIWQAQYINPHITLTTETHAQSAVADCLHIPGNRIGIGAVRNVIEGRPT